MLPLFVSSSLRALAFDTPIPVFLLVSTSLVVLSSIKHTLRSIDHENDAWPCKSGDRTKIDLALVIDALR